MNVRGQMIVVKRKGSKKRHEEIKVGKGWGRVLNFGGSYKLMDGHLAVKRKEFKNGGMVIRVAIVPMKRYRELEKFWKDFRFL